MADTKLTYAASTTITAGVASLASSSTRVAGWSSAEIDNSSTKHLDKKHSGKVTSGTSPAAGLIEVWVIPKREDGSYHDTFDGTNKAVTVTSRAMLRKYGKLLEQLEVSTTSNAPYEYERSVKEACGYMPEKYQLWFTQDTTVALHATTGNHVQYEKGSYTTTA